MLRLRLAVALLAVIGVIVFTQVITSMNGTAAANTPLALLRAPVHPQTSGEAATATPARAIKKVTPIPTAAPTRLIASLVQPDQLVAQAAAAPAVEVAPAARVQPAQQPAAPAAKLSAPAAVPLISNAKMINSVPLDQIVVMNDATQQRVRAIFAQGQAMGRNPRAFAKVGDSTMAYPALMLNFVNPYLYRLGQYSALQPTIDYYIGSFAHESPAVKKGMHTWTEFDPTWTITDTCQTDETPMGCEFRLTNPSVVIIRLGANDYGDPVMYDRTMRQILDFWISYGVVPVLGTKPDRQEGPQNTINGIIAELAAEYRIPLWDYDKVAATVPNRGLDKDNIHMLASNSHDYAANATYQSGDPLEDLTALMMLDAVRKTTH
jgi:hypothetical protein